LRAAQNLVDSAIEDAKQVAEESDAKETEELRAALGAAPGGGSRMPRGTAGVMKDLADRQKRRATRTQRDTLDLALTDLLPTRMDELSGGQRQRVFIGRCLVQEPIALVLDEPNTYLDIRHQVELSTLLHTLARNQNVAILMASHDLNLAALTADRLLLLHEGRVRAEGSPSEVLTPEILTPTYGIPMQRIDRGPTTPPIVIPRM
jgi:DNA polymerase-3 subunit delta'